ncbi:MAG: hypothetical protein ACI4D9_00535 [Lachnospiraceae bacterium]
MKGVAVLGYTIDFSGLTKKVYDEANNVYKACLIYIRVDEINKGMRMHRINKPTKKGTRIKFVSIESEKEYRKELQNLQDEADKIGLALEIKSKDLEEQHDVR